MKEKIKKEKVKTEKAKTAGAEKPESNEGCSDINCNVHGSLKARGRVFEGKVIRKFPKRITIEFERMVYVRKYERYAKSKTKIHARLPDCIESQIGVGDLVRVQECRPLSKIIHFVFKDKIKSAGEI